MTELTIEERVAAGVRYLDERVPDWLDRITLPKLDMRSDCSCVIGQVIGDYSRLVDRWVGGLPDGVTVISAAEAAEFGFDSMARAEESDANDSGNPAFASEFDALQAEWERVIQARRGQTDG